MIIKNENSKNVSSTNNNLLVKPTNLLLAAQNFVRNVINERKVSGTVEKALANDNMRNVFFKSLGCTTKSKTKNKSTKNKVVPVPLRMAPTRKPLSETYTNLKDPLPTPDTEEKVKNKEYGYKFCDGELFVKGPTASDVKQGHIGDCYLMAAMASLAETNPEYVKNMIKDNKDGAYTVRLYRYQGTNKPVQGKNGWELSQPGIKEFYVTVDSEFLVDKDGNKLYADSTDKNELWVSIIEKAYAQGFGQCYGLTGSGGYGETALYNMTGVMSNVIKTKASVDDIYNAVSSGVKNNRPMTAITHLRSKKENVDGIVYRHAYSVLGVKMVNGVKMITIRNPWAFREWDGQTDDKDGVFDMPISEFKKHFIEFTILQGDLNV